MTLYEIDFDHGLFLAPLSGYTSWPMRLLCRRYGAELAYTEMISAEGLIRNRKTTGTLLERPEHDRPLVAQLFTASPGEAALASRIIEDCGIDGIDLNMGCPVKKVVSRGAGAALMTEPERARDLAEHVVRQVKIPVSVKMRAGWDSSFLNAPSLAASLEETGICAICIHPRTRVDMYRGIPRWEVLQEMNQRVSLPIIASGDISRVDDLSRLASLGADAFMIGRAAIGRPWIFRELTGAHPPDRAEHAEVMLSHLDMICSCFGKDKGVRYMRKFLSSYVKGFTGASLFRKMACSAQTQTALSEIIRA
ncbi:MAG: tRNA-dihydrouridine synthase family protein, partial [Desulfomonilia bacterium]|nr:tRNA-dihydrouridine synthase family protein [Desulfomonilia bacterium]